MSAGSGQYNYTLGVLSIRFIQIHQPLICVHDLLLSPSELPLILISLDPSLLAYRLYGI